NKRAVLFVNGFLSEKTADVKDWTSELYPTFADNTWYHLDWEATNLQKLGSYLTRAPDAAASEMVKGLAMAAGRSVPKGAGPWSVVTGLMSLASNPWHSAMVKAQLAGIMLADAIARTPDWRFTLMGHSLGARVIYFALEALATKSETPIDDVYLL